MLMDLTTDMGTPAIKYRDDVTHEMQVWALHPDIDVNVDGPLGSWTWNGALLMPANYGYQFAAEDDDSAYNRIRGIVQMIMSRQLSPDTDFRRRWDRLFSDGETLLERGWVVEP